MITPPIRVRLATDEDAAEVADIWIGAFRATYHFAPAHPEDEIRSWIRDYLLPETESWVAKGGDGVIGFLSLGDGWIEQLYVRPGFTGAGTGTRLVNFAKERQPAGLQLWTFQVNHGARRFYERHGFRAMELTDGDNEEGQPDVRYAWK